MYKFFQKKNYLCVNMNIKKGMLKRRRMAVASILNVRADKKFMRVIK